MRRSTYETIALLNSEGQRRLEMAYRRRLRRQASFDDHADAYLRALQDEGVLERYLIPGVDPFELLASARRRSRA